MKNILIGTILFLLTISGNAQTAQDDKLIQAAILNYVEAFIETNTMKVYESIVDDRDVRGYYSKDGQIKEAKIAIEPLISLAQQLNASHKIKKEMSRKITVFEVLDKMAAAKMEAKSCIYYFQLTKINEKWMIINVLWQDYPN